MTTKRIDNEVVPVAAIVECVEPKTDELVLHEGRDGIVSHLGGDHPVGLTLPDPRQDVHVHVIEQQPNLGLLGRRRAVVGLHLDEARNGADLVIDSLVENPIDPDRLVDPYGANRRARFASGHHLRGDGHRWPRIAGRRLWFGGICRLALLAGVHGSAHRNTPHHDAAEHDATEP